MEQFELFLHIFVAECIKRLNISQEFNLWSEYPLKVCVVEKELVSSHYVVTII
jgi:hypothetical protein